MFTSEVKWPAYTAHPPLHGAYQFRGERRGRWPACAPPPLHDRCQFRGKGRGKWPVCLARPAPPSWMGDVTPAAQPGFHFPPS
eukprot:356735-Chlamydomonas_euryale.AAC.7